MLSIACYVSQSYAPGASVAAPPTSARAAVRMNTADELGISCEGDCEAVYSKLPESVQPGVVTVTPRGVEQNVLPEVPLTPMAVDAASVRRLWVLVLCLGRFAGHS